MTNEERLKKAAKQIQAHVEADKTPGWDRRIEAAIVVIFGNGDTRKGREALIALAHERLEKIARKEK